MNVLWFHCYPATLCRKHVFQIALQPQIRRIIILP